MPEVPARMITRQEPPEHDFVPQGRFFAYYSTRFLLPVSFSRRGKQILLGYIQFFLPVISLLTVIIIMQCTGGVVGPFVITTVDKAGSVVLLIYLIIEVKPVLGHISPKRNLRLAKP